MNRRDLLASGVLGAVLPVAWAHHGWSGFDQDRPIYLEGKAVKVVWRNPRAEIDLELPAALQLPADLAKRSVPAKSAAVDGPKLLAAAQLPKRRDKVWEIELAPLTRMQAWNVPEIRVGDSVAVLGYVAPEEKGDPVLRVEYLFHAGKVYGLRSSPA
jgi:hypothetical protein